MSAREAGRTPGRLQRLWANMPLMRSFFLYAAGCVLASIVVSVVLMLGLMSVYDTFQRAAWEGHVDVEGGPYVYDAVTDELIPAVAIDLSSPSDRIVFLGIRGGMGYAPDVGDDCSGGWINADTGAPIGYATLEMVREDPSITIYDWGGNYTERDYQMNGGYPYDPISIDGSSLAEYDARERAERRAVDGEFLTIDDNNPNFVVSNIGYFVLQNSMMFETPIMVALRIATVLTPFAVLIVLSILFFRRFYRRRLGGPLAVFCDCADRVARQDLDFVTPEVPGREFTRLGDAFEKMRASLEASQRELWRTAEERRRLNAAFAHDLRTPVTVLKGTVEMAQMRAEAGEPVGAKTIATLSSQIDRLESYAQAMSGIARLEDREVVRTPVAASDFVSMVRTQAQSQAGARRPDVALGIDAGGVAPDATLMLDRSLVEEVLGNILGNACDYARARVRMVLSLDDDHRMLAMSVADDGPGFSPEALHRGCEPFFGEAKSSEHFGLGLNIVSTLARLHGGSVTLANGEDGGGAVTVTFDVGSEA